MVERNGADPALGNPPRVAVVLPGGGAYEAGALSVLLPALEGRGERVSVYCGTSVGAINAAMLASVAHQSPSAAGAALLERWRSISKAEVTGRLIGPGLALGVASLVGEALGVPGMRFRGLIDPKPLRRNLDNWIDWGAVHENVASERVAGLCAVATSLRSGSPVGFLEWARDGSPIGASEEIAYAPVRMSSVHVRASAAIPGLFPPVTVDAGPASGPYVDGATRLNSPIRPALDLGADRVIVVSFEPLTRRKASPGTAAAPGFADIAANVLDGLMADQIVADVQRLGAINSFFAESPEASSRAARAYRRVRGRRPYRKVGYALVAPRRRRELARIAERVLEVRYGGLRALRDPDFSLTARALGSGANRGELLTFLFFDPEFIRQLIDAGRRDARRWLGRHPHFWCSDASHDLDQRTRPEAEEREVALLEEWRSIRRR
jgi:NTE family protein